MRQLMKWEMLVANRREIAEHLSSGMEQRDVATLYGVNRKYIYMLVKEYMSIKYVVKGD